MGELEKQKRVLKTFQAINRGSENSINFIKNLQKSIEEGTPKAEALISDLKQFVQVVETNVESGTPDVDMADNIGLLLPDDLCKQYPTMKNAKKATVESTNGDAEGEENGSASTKMHIDGVSEYRDGNENIDDFRPECTWGTSNGYPTEKKDDRVLPKHRPIGHGYRKQDLLAPLLNPIIKDLKQKPMRLSLIGLRSKELSQYCKSEGISMKSIFLNDRRFFVFGKDADVTVGFHTTVSAKKKDDRVLLKHRPIGHGYRKQDLLAPLLNPIIKDLKQKPMRLS